MPTAQWEVSLPLQFGMIPAHHAESSSKYSSHNLHKSLTNWSQALSVCLTVLIPWSLRWQNLLGPWCCFSWLQGYPQPFSSTASCPSCVVSLHPISSFSVLEVPLHTPPGIPDMLPSLLSSQLVQSGAGLDRVSYAPILCCCTRGRDIIQLLNQHQQSCRHQVQTRWTLVLL